MNHLIFFQILIDIAIMSTMMTSSEIWNHDAPHLRGRLEKLPL